MARTDSKWMPLFIADYLGDTMHLSRAQHGSYLLLLMAYWKRGGPLPDDDAELSAIAKCTSTEWKRERGALAKLFQIADGWWKQGRADKELARAAANTKAKAEAGAKGAAKRWQTDGTAIAEPLADDMANSSRTDAPLPSPSHSPDGEKFSKTRKRPISPDWQLTLKDRQHAAAKGLDPQTISTVAEHFRDYHTALGTLSKDWGASWRTWVANHLRFSANARQGRGAGQSWGHRSQPSSVLAAGAAVLSRLENQPGFRPDGGPDLEGDPTDGGGSGDGASGGADGPIIDGTSEPERNNLAAHPSAHRNENAA